MTIQRFTAPTSREALAKARAVFGEGTLILSNRPVPGGIEVVATAEDTLSALAQAEAPAPAPVAVAPAPRPLIAPPTPEQQDADQLSMSTLSFQDYVRERMLRRRHDAAQVLLQAEQAARLPSPAAAPAVVQPVVQPAAQVPVLPPLTAPAPAHLLAQAAAMEEALAPLPTIEYPAQAPAPVQAAVEPVAVVTATAAPVAAPVEAPVAAAVAAPAPVATGLPQGLLDELQAMKALIDDRFNTLAWLGETRQDPIRASLMHKLIRSGYSPTLSRTLLEHLPAGTGPADALRWLTATLERNLRTDAPGQRILQEGGIFALVGATGVGKTTTVAKLAGQAVREHGSAAVGMITLDTQRIGAHDQLRAFGRQMGVVAHQAHDRAALAELLNLFENRHLVLIDTAGLAPGDARMRGMQDMLDLPGVNRTLVLNAGSQGDTLDAVLTAFRGTGTQHAILSKTDEAVKLGPALDTLIRHQFTLRGVTCGQRVPEDWQDADAAALVRQSMRAPARSAFDPRPADLGFFFAEGNPLPHAAEAALA